MAEVLPPARGFTFPQPVDANSCLLSSTRLIESMIPVRMINFPQVHPHPGPAPLGPTQRFAPVLNVVQDSDRVCCVAEGGRRALWSSDVGFHPGGNSAAWNEDIRNCYSEKSVTHGNKHREKKTPDCNMLCV